MDISRLKDALAFIERETHLRTKSYRMLSDGVQGEFLQAFSLMMRLFVLPADCRRTALWTP